MYGGGHLFQNKAEDFFGDLFFCETFWLYLAPKKRENHFCAYFQRFCGVGVGRFKTVLFSNKVETFLCDISYYLRLTSLPFLAQNKNEDFFLRILPIFDNSGGLKVFIFENKVEGFLIHRLFLSNSFASYNQSWKTFFGD